MTSASPGAPTDTRAPAHNNKTVAIAAGVAAGAGTALFLGAIAGISLYCYDRRRKAHPSAEFRSAIPAPPRDAASELSKEARSHNPFVGVSMAIPIVVHGGDIG